MVKLNVAIGCELVHQIAAPIHFNFTQKPMKNFLNNLPSVRLTTRIGFETAGLNCEWIPFMDSKLQYNQVGNLLNKVHLRRLHILIFQFLLIISRKLSKEDSHKIMMEEESKVMEQRVEEMKRMQEMQIANQVLKQQAQKPNN